MNYYQRYTIIIALSGLILPSVSNAEELDRAGKRSVSKSAAVIANLHKKARKALVNAAQDSTFGAYFSAHEDGHKHELKSRIENISLNVQNNFHVEEMCLIDPTGTEITRIVGAEIAHDLSNQEKSADFFAPSFAQEPRTVYVSPVYMSPDADKWVLAYVTPIMLDGEKKAILHYEHGLDVYQRALSNVADPAGVNRIAVSNAGWVVWDENQEISNTKKEDSDDPAVYFEKFQFAGLSIDNLIAAVDLGNTIQDAAGRQFQVSYSQVEDWYVIGTKQVDGDLFTLIDD